MHFPLVQSHAHGASHSAEIGTSPDNKRAPSQPAHKKAETEYDQLSSPLIGSKTRHDGQKGCKMPQNCEIDVEPFTFVCANTKPDINVSFQSSIVVIYQYQIFPNSEGVTLQPKKGLHRKLAG